MRLFGGERMTNIMERVGFTDEQPIESGLVTKSIQRAQGKVENHNYEIRKHVLEYDDVMNKQRAVIYADRRAMLEGTFDSRTFMTADAGGESQRGGRRERARERASERVGFRGDAQRSGPDLPDQARGDASTTWPERIARRFAALLRDKARAAYEAKEAEVTPEILRVVEQRISCCRSSTGSGWTTST